MMTWCDEYDEKNLFVFRVVQRSHQEHIHWKDAAECGSAVWCVNSAGCFSDRGVPVDEGCAHVHWNHRPHRQDLHCHRSKCRYNTAVVSCNTKCEKPKAWCFSFLRATSPLNMPSRLKFWKKIALTVTVQIIWQGQSYHLESWPPHWH